MTFLEMSLSGGVFVLAIAAFRALTLRRLPKGTFVAFWWLAAARLLLPVELTSRFSVYTLLEALGPKAVPVAPDALPAPVVPSAPVAPAVPPVIAIPTRPAAMPAPAPTPFPVWTALWLSVGLLLAAWFLIRYVRWRRRFREALPADCPGLETWFQLRRRVEVRVTDQIAAPLTYGLFRPVILLPRTMDFKDEEALTCVLAHERAHIRRFDGLLKLALTAALCLHWFNPAVWLLYVLGNRDMELRCDEAAVLALGEDSRERYALALIRLAENRNVPLCGFAHRNGMEERIKAIMSIKKKSLLACFIALALVLGITTAFATSAKPAETDGPWNADMTDRELLAKASAETAALWEETLAPYEPFGLTWTFDDPDLDGNGLTMTWEGHEVRGIYDEGKSSWITERAGDSTFGPGAVELYTVYEDGTLTGLRLATEEEQKAFNRDRRLSADSLKVETLADSVRYDSGHIYFTIPESEEPWSIFIRGRVLLEDGSGQSVRYLEKESEQAEWVPRMTYSFEVADAAYEELTMDVRYGNADYCYPLTPLLPEKAPLPVEPLPEGKADMPEEEGMIWPVDGGTVSTSYGTQPNGTEHVGVDIALERGAPVYAAAAGTVTASSYDARVGYYVALDHGNKVSTTYAHCDSLLVKQGDTVKRGQTIATVGSSGMSTGPHLHFRVLENDKDSNPLEFFPYMDVVKSMTGKGWKGEGYPVYAVDVGHVIDAGWDEEYGYYVEVLQDETNEKRTRSITRYSNCGEIQVRRGSPVKAGDIIANEGVDPLRVEYDVEDLFSIHQREEMMEKYLVDGEYPKNSKGQTYGPYLYDWVENRPDLQRIGIWEVISYTDLEEGTEAYISNQAKWVYNSKLETMERSDVVIKENGERYIPVYDVEGNKIGLYRWH